MLDIGGFLVYTVDSQRSTIVEFDYFQISWYIVYTLMVIFIPALLVRLLRIMPVYIKTGSMGDSDNSWVFNTYRKLSFLEKLPKQLYNLFMETHPEAIITDAIAIGLLGLVLFIAWGLIPFIVVIALFFYGIISLAKHLRERHVKKEEFVQALKGD